MAIWRVRMDGRDRCAVGPVGGGPEALLPGGVTLGGLLAGSALFDGYRELPRTPLAEPAAILPPIDAQEVWASGVTFLTSRYAREQESGQADVYREVYFAERPELFLKAVPGTIRGPGETIGIRADSGWDVPEPELAVVVDASGRIVAYTIANDVSSRSIEGENALYLPQAKIYDHSCALGPCLVPLEEAPPARDMHVRLTVHRKGEVVYEDGASLADLKRSPEELVSWLFRARSFPTGVVLLTGTGIVPPPEFSLSAGDRVDISVTGLGSLSSEVQVIGAPTSTVS